SLFFLLSYSIRPPVSSTLLPYTTLFRSRLTALEQTIIPLGVEKAVFLKSCLLKTVIYVGSQNKIVFVFHQIEQFVIDRFRCIHIDRKSTRLNSSHVSISYAVFCLKKKTK